MLATATVVVPLDRRARWPSSAVVAGAGDVAAAALARGAAGSLAYSGLFVAAGFWFRRAVWWGLAFVLLWENVVAHAVAGSRAFTILGWGGPCSPAAGVDVEVDARQRRRGRVVLPLLAVAGCAAATWRYRRADVD